MRYAADHGIAVAAMEPLLGGALVEPPAAVQAVWDAADHRRTPADWGLQWLWHQPEVSVVLSGMNAMQQLEENLASAERSGVGSLSAAEVALVDRVREQYHKLWQIPCGQCSYCMPCPSGVNIPRNFEIYNYGHVHSRPGDARYFYSELEEGERAVNCTECHTCESRCPQGITISEWMPRVHAVLGEKAEYPEA